MYYFDVYRNRYIVRTKDEHHRLTHEHDKQTDSTTI